MKSLGKTQVAWVLLAIGCGGPGDLMVPADEESDVSEQKPLSTPLVRLVSPPVWQAGAVVAVLGSDFVAPDRGRTEVSLEGQFAEQGGGSRAVSMTVATEHRNPGYVEFVFEPAYPPAGFGHEVGTFTGMITARNVDDRSASPDSQPIQATVEVGPSLILWSAQPDDGPCAGKERVTATLDGTEMVIDLEAIGMTPATAYTPLTLTASYVSLVIERLNELPEAGVPMIVSERLVSGRRASLALDFGVLPEGQVESAVQVNLTAENGLDEPLRRVFTVTVGREYSVVYDGNVEIAELYAPMLVSACLPGGPYGRDYNYSAGTSESRSRSVGYSANVGVDIWVVNVGFGFSVDENVSSSDSENLGISGRVLPNQFGVFYRQTQRLLRIGQILTLDRCGTKRAVGEARVTDWNWAPDLAITTNGQCPPAPASNLPPAQVFE